jgi:hypothetical protein
VPAALHALILALSSSRSGTPREMHVHHALVDDGMIRSPRFLIFFANL